MNKSATLFSYLRAHLRHAFCFSLLINLLAVVPTLYLLQVFDRVLSSRSLETLGMLAAFAFIAIGMSWAFDMVRAKILSHAGSLLDRRLAQPLLTAQLEMQARQPGGHSGQGMRDLALVRSLLSGPAACALFDLPWAPFYLLLIFFFHWTLGLLALASALLLLALAVVYGRRTAAQARASEHHRREADRLMTQLFRNADIVSTLGMTKRMINAWEKMRTRAAAGQGAAVDASAAYKAHTRFLRQCIQVIALALGAWLVTEQHTTGGVMLATTVLLGKALMPIEQIIGGWTQIAEGRRAWDRLDKLAMHAAKAHTHTPAPTELPAPAGHLRVEQACLADPADGRPLLADIDFQLAAGETLAVIGANASGKTMLARLLTGLAKPDAGAVRLDGADIAQIPRESIGPHLGYMPQEIALFAGSVAENIARTHRHAGNTLLDATAIVRAARRAQAHDLILRLPQGYETEIGESGQGLSGGQRQRIALARALYGSPALLILDEPDAHLDTTGVLQLQSVLRELKADGITVVFITHRMPLVQLADKVLLLRDGRIDCFGPRTAVERWIETRQEQAGRTLRRVAQ